MKFQDGLVVEVIADGKQYDLLLRSAREEKLSSAEVVRRMEKINTEGCK